MRATHATRWGLPEQEEPEPIASRRADVSVFSRENVVEKAQARFAQRALRLERLNSELELEFKHYDETKAELEALHIRSEIVLPPLLDAAYGVHSRGVPDTRLEQATVTPPPLPPVSE